MNNSAPLEKAIQQAYQIGRDAANQGQTLRSKVVKKKLDSVIAQSLSTILEDLVTKPEVLPVNSVPEPEAVYRKLVRQAIIYHPPRIEDTPTLLTPKDITSKFNVAVFAKGQATALPEYIKAGFNGTAVQYYILNEAIAAPSGASDTLPTNESEYCNNAYHEYKAFQNNVTYGKGKYAQIQDSIIGRFKSDHSKKFDHDLNSSTPPIWADESWFVHRKDNGKRYKGTLSNGVGFFANHANKDWQDYFIARSIANLAPGMKGIFFDNFDLDWRRITQHGSTPVEFETTTDFTIATIELATRLRDALRQVNPEYKLFANMTNGENWNPYVEVLDGGFKEDFVLDWGRGPYRASIVVKQLDQAERWIAAGNEYIAGAPGNMYFGRKRFDKEALFALAAFLLITDGVHASFLYYNKYGEPKASRWERYEQYYEYPEYYLQLGMPVGPRKQLTPLLFEREFENGKVILDLSNFTGKVLTM